ncbi:type I restriction endonuclease subunit R [Propioniciclava coleopterorum]|uniref:Type I restriction endonuclease subunit R n=1 Tax=Propioniciclava coleopterorum TaxID=2714937 RepID=A0A6G7Y7F1_9ACTN|nr:type I restriction endonuclease [Propioniciclava coleopterorum]QIK72742.1 type I restriction endonuclease subunit R [Propioniciclava coleopterorum]
MSAQHREKTFEDELVAHLAAHGWEYSPDDDGYDVDRALYPPDVEAWLAGTQPQEWDKLVKPSFSPEAQRKAVDSLLTRLAKVLDQDPKVGGGSLAVLRKGFKHQTASFTMMQRRPEQTVNETINARYAANRLRVMRQVHYSVKKPALSLDLVFFVNGIPVATAELKTDFTQSINDAKRQYLYDRPPAGEPLLGFGSRALVHFAVSNDEVWMTTRLAGEQTRFLPFNRGVAGHAGNGADEDGGSPTSYLWRDVLARDAWLDILGKFIHYETTQHKDPDTGAVASSRALIFPRFHQLDAVTRLVADARVNGPGQRYLIQHSAGSGKTRSIAWTAHRLATLHDAANKKVFDTVIVVTDRTVLDDQLQEAVKQIETTSGVVATISKREASKESFSSKSAYLASTLAGGKLIVVVTLQTFPFVLEAIRQNKALAGRSFAVIADEAHSSQTGQAAAKLKQVLSAQEFADLADGGEVDVEAVLAADAAAQADAHNISFVAFTATPKAKTIELFGTRQADGSPPRAFHVYTMAQAIEEGFILDVLANYTSYYTAWQLAKNAESNGLPVVRTDEEGNLVDQDAARKGLLRWVKLHPTNIAQKVAIIVEFFEANVKHLLDGQAKAMVVTDSRMAAVRYKRAIDAYIAKQGYSDVATLVAFSGEVVFSPSDLLPEDAGTLIADEPYTESTMNPGVKDLRGAFDTDEYQVMIVANKFQTGFDQPKLCFMAVDKRLDGVATVQTLSRLNRALPGKKTMVLDFVNNPDDVLASFRQFYAEAELSGTTDPNLIHDLATKLDLTDIYWADELGHVVEVFIQGLGNNALAGALQPVKHRYMAQWKAAHSGHDKAKVNELDQFRKDVSSYVRLYDFISQVFAFEDTDVEKHAIFYRLLAPHLRTDQADTPVDLTGVTLPLIYQKKTGDKQDLGLAQAPAADPMKPITGVGTKPPREPQDVLLERVIQELNAKFTGEDFRESQVKAWVAALTEALREDQSLVAQAKVNSLEQFLASPSLHDAVMLAVAETHVAQGRMAELFGEKGAVEQAVLEALGEIFYRDEHDAKN